MVDIYDNHFDQVNSLDRGRYEGCEFNNCVFSNLHFHQFEFIDCTFFDCDLSNTKLGNTSFKEVRFHNSKLVGTNFSDCNPFLFQVHFKECNLEYADFSKLKLDVSSFVSCKLVSAIFSNVDLSTGSLQDCDLLNALFEECNLEKCSFMSSYNLSLNPRENRLKGARIPNDQAINLLSNYKINWID